MEQDTEFEKACIRYGMHLMTLSLTLSQLKGINETPAFDVFLQVLKETSTSMGMKTLTKEEVTRFNTALSVLIHDGGAQLSEIKYQNMLKALAATVLQQ